MRNLIAIAAVTTAATAIIDTPTASAHDGATGIVETRMHAMKKMGEAVRGIKGMLSEQDSYNAKGVRKQAKAIKQHAGKAMLKQFPKGSLQKPTHAKAEIWSDWDRFSQLAKRLETLANGLEMAAGNGLMMAGKASMMNGQGSMEGMRTKSALSIEAIGQMPADGVFAMVVETCSTCHREFRARKP